jgi:hypothetical protein
MNRIAGKKDIAVCPAFVAAILPYFGMVTELLGHKAGLLVLARFALDADDFLQRDDVSVQFAQDLCYAMGTDSPVKTAALMDIVSGDAQAH